MDASVPTYLPSYLPTSLPTYLLSNRAHPLTHKKQAKNAQMFALKARAVGEQRRRRRLHRLNKDDLFKSGNKGGAASKWSDVRSPQWLFLSIKLTPKSIGQIPSRLFGLASNDCKRRIGEINQNSIRLK